MRLTISHTCRSGDRRHAKMLAALIVIFAAGMPDHTLADSPTPPDVAATAWSIVSQVRGTWQKPPDRLQCNFSSGGAYLGNGDLGVVVGGTPDQLAFYVGKSDFFGVERGRQVPVGRLQFSIPSLLGASYDLAQNIGPATVTGQFTNSSAGLSLESWVARDQNSLVVRLHNTGSTPLPVRAQLLDGWETPSNNQFESGSDWTSIRVSPDSAFAVAGNRLFDGSPAGFIGRIADVQVFASTLNPAAPLSAEPLYGWQLTANNSSSPNPATPPPAEPPHGSQLTSHSASLKKPAAPSLSEPLYGSRLTADNTALLSKGPVAAPNGDDAGEAFDGTDQSEQALGLIQMPQRQFTFLAHIQAGELQQQAFVFTAVPEPYGPRRLPYHRGFALGISQGRLFAQLNRTAVEAATPLPLHQWLAVAAVYDGAQMTLWVDGKIVAQTSEPSPLQVWQWQPADIQSPPASVPPGGVPDSGNEMQTAPVGTNVFQGRPGYAWFQTQLPVGTDPNQSLEFARVQDNATVYLNGVQVLNHKGKNQPFSVPLAGHLNSGGPNIVTVCVQATGKDGGILGKVILGTPGQPDSTLDPELISWFPTAAEVMGAERDTIHTGDPKIPFDGCCAEGLLAQRVIGVPGSLQDGALAFTIPPDASATVLVAAETDRQSPDYANATQQLLQRSDDASLSALDQARQAWWRQFWSKSFVEISQKDVQSAWYGSLYDLACCSRADCAPPGLWGNFITEMVIGWQGDYTLDYNHEATFWGAMAANHLELTDNYVTPMLQNLPRAAAFARSLGYQGLFGYTHLIPAPGWDDDPSNFMNQKSAWLFGTTDCAMRWKYTHDLDYARKVYPYLSGVADFWDHYLTLKNDVYVDENDAPDEFGDAHATNPATTLAFLRLLYPTLIEMSTALHMDGAPRAQWQDVLDHLSPLPIVPAASLPILVTALGQEALADKTVIPQCESNTDWVTVAERLGPHQLLKQEGSSPGMASHQCIYPGWAIGLESSESDRKAALNTVAFQQTWYDHNNTSSFYPAAACAGYDPASILDHAHLMVTHFAMPNFGYPFGGGGVENFSTIPSMLCAMFIQSYQQNIHLFPDWPLNEDARFGNLQACGGFLISSAISNGQVLYVQVRSNSGERLRLANPWMGKAVLVNTGGANSQTVSGAVLTLPTTAAETLLLTPVSK
jgi:hypothetical protein